MSFSQFRILILIVLKVVVYGKSFVFLYPLHIKITSGVKFSSSNKKTYSLQGNYPVYFVYSQKTQEKNSFWVLYYTPFQV